MADDKKARIRELNDRFRTTLTGGKVYMTAGVGALPETSRQMAWATVQSYDAFTADNDPHQEHDFGSFEIDGRKLFWKIDYYDAGDSDLGAEDPSDAASTERALTLMLAEEY